MELPGIAQAINAFEGHAWYLRHDDADGRIEGSIDGALREIEQLVRIAAEVFALKADLDIEDFGAMRLRLQDELANYTVFLERRWQQLFRIGALFRLERDGNQPSLDIFEVVAVYGSVCIGTKGCIFCRVWGTGTFTFLSDRDCERMIPMEGMPKFSDTPGFLRSTGTGSGRFFPDAIQAGCDIREAGTVFAFRGHEADPRGGLWEAFYETFTRPGTDEVVVIAMNWNKTALAEFTGADLWGIEVLNVPPRFVTKERGCTSIPSPEIVI